MADPAGEPRSGRRHAISDSGIRRCRPLRTLGQQQGLDVRLDLFQVILHLVNPLVLPGFAGLDLCLGLGPQVLDFCLELRSHGLHLRLELRLDAPYLRPEEASQPEDDGQRSTGLDPVCKHGWRNGHGPSGVARLG